MVNSLTRPLAVVTGASNGIGYELAKQFAQNGFDLLITATGPSINEAAQAFEELGAGVEAVQADLSTYDGVETLYNQIKATGRPVDAIAINAGVGVGGDFARETDLKDELNLINLNVVSSVHLAKRVVKDMVEHGKGRILFTSSIAAIMPAKILRFSSAMFGNRSRYFFVAWSGACWALNGRYRKNGLPLRPSTKS